MNALSLIKNSLVAFLAQSVSMLASVLTTLLLPRLLGVEPFGYWQLFIFYAGYVGFFHLGLTDGVYLLFGGTPRNEIDKREINSQFLLLVCYELVFSLGLGAAALTLPLGPSRSFVLVCTAMLIFVNNGWYYCGYTLQAMNETIRYSKSVLVDRGIFMVALVVLMAMRQTSYEVYIFCFLATKTLALLYCLLSFRDIMSSGLYPIRHVLRSGGRSIRVGSKLMIANIASGLIVGIVRYGIDVQWGIEAFSKVSFSISLVNFILQFVQQFALVLFPALRQAAGDEVQKVYSKIHWALAMLSPFIYLMYYPAYLLVLFWLPAYSESMRYFAILLPICLFDAKMTLACATYFKVFRKEGLLLKINLGAVAGSLAATSVGIFLFQSVEIALVLTVGVVMARSVFSELRIACDSGFPADTLLLQLVVMSVLYCAAISLPVSTGTFVLSLVPCAVFILVNRRGIHHLGTRSLSIFRNLTSRRLSE